MSRDATLRLTLDTAPLVERMVRLQRLLGLASLLRRHTLPYGYRLIMRSGEETVVKPARRSL